RVSFTATATSLRRAHNTVSHPASASTLAKAVPQEPAPSTAMRSGRALAAPLRVPRVEELRGRLFAPDLREQFSHPEHQEPGHLLQRPLVLLLALAAVAGQVHRFTELDGDFLARERLELLLVVVVDVPGAPPSRRDHRHVVAQRQPGHPDL